MATPFELSKFSFEALKALAQAGKVPVDYSLSGIAASASDELACALRIWTALNENRPVPALQLILGERPSQRDADVAARMLLWLVSPEGHWFQQKADNLGQALKAGETPQHG